MVILFSVRRPIAPAYKGGFRDSYPEEILMLVYFFSPHRKEEKNKIK